jgi:hypothetical protein
VARACVDVSPLLLALVAGCFSKPTLTDGGPIAEVGVWTPVTPSSINLIDSLGCGNYGVSTVAFDPMRPSDAYALADCQGIWKSTDFGYTWSGPINTGTNGMAMLGAGGLVIPRASNTTPPVIYVANIRGGVGFWRSDDGGVNWTRHNVASGGNQQDFSPPAVDPHDAKHLLMAGHQSSLLVESHDGGDTWSQVSTDPGMTSGAGAAVDFLDTGQASTTAGTFLWVANFTAGSIGAWRTADGGAHWAQVDQNQSINGVARLYQPGGGVVYMTGPTGVLRSADYGKTWTLVVGTAAEASIVGTRNHVYAAYGFPAGPAVTLPPNLEVAPAQGATGWISAPTPTAMTQGAATMATSIDGAHAVLVTANFNAGLWMYVEP